MLKDGIDIVVNGRKYDSVEFGNSFGPLMSLTLDYLNYMSVDAMKIWLKEASLLVEETLTWKKNASLKRKITYINKLLDKNISRLMLQRIVTNIILSSEGLNTLPGFGWGDVGSNYQKNPEIISIYD